MGRIFRKKHFKWQILIAHVYTHFICSFSCLYGNMAAILSPQGQKPHGKDGGTVRHSQVLVASLYLHTGPGCLCLLVAFLLHEKQASKNTCLYV